MSIKGLGLLLSALCITVAVIRQTAPPSSWQTIDADGLFSFRLPQGFSKTEMAVAGNYLGEYYKGETRLFFIWGDTTSPAYDERRRPEMRDYEEQNTRLKGKRANIRTYWISSEGRRVYHAELNVGNWERGQVTLFMGLEGGDPKTLETARQIFWSVDFPIPDPERPRGR
jgi:hypothetical protein